MMSGLVMEVKKDSVIVLTNNGEFKVKKNVNNLKVGDEYQFTSTNSNRFRRYAAVAASMVLIFVGVYGTTAYVTPFGHLNVDINPSVDVTYNRFLRVIDVDGINEDGKILVSSLDSIKNQKIREAVEDIIEEAVNLEYISDEEGNYILLSVTEPKGKLDSNNIIENSKFKSVETITFVTSNAEYKKAKEKGFSPGKIKLIEKVTEKANEKGYYLEELDKPLEDIQISNLMKSLKVRENENNKNKEKNQNNGNNKTDAKDKEKEKGNGESNKGGNSNGGKK